MTLEGRSTKSCEIVAVLSTTSNIIRACQGLKNEVWAFVVFRSNSCHSRRPRHVAPPKVNSQKHGEQNGTERYQFPMNPKCFVKIELAAFSFGAVSFGLDRRLRSIHEPPRQA